MKASRRFWCWVWQRLVRVKGFASRGNLRYFVSQNPMFYVYVLHSESDQGLYIGYSANLRRRIMEHQEGLAFATSFRGPWRLIYYEAYVEQEDAIGREQYLKSGGGRRFLKRQLTHFLAKHPLRDRAA
jgi:putative endonuclease